jgi:SAM-dependent methyltransferase
MSIRQPSEKDDFSQVTELPNSQATKEQLSRLYQRYYLAAKLSRQRRVLEIACGSGMGLGYLAREAASVVGGDYAENLLEIARSHYKDRAQLILLDAHDLPFEDNSFDVALIFEAIYYMADMNKVLSEVRRVLDSQGTLIICTVNCEWNEFAPSPYSHKYYSVPELSTLLEAQGFTNIECHGAFPVSSKQGLKNEVTSLIRKGVIKFDLMPKTLEGRARFKRLFYGKLLPMPAEIMPEDFDQTEPLIPIPANQSNSGYKILYFIAHRS